MTTAQMTKEGAGVLQESVETKAGKTSNFRPEGFRFPDRGQWLRWPFQARFMGEVFANDSSFELSNG